MAYVNCARYAQEQNLIAVQVDGEIYYEACKDIAQGTELLVWYGDCYLQFMGIPVALKEMNDATNEDEAQSRLLVHHVLFLTWCMQELSARSWWMTAMRKFRVRKEKRTGFCNLPCKSPSVRNRKSGRVFEGLHRKMSSWGYLYFRAKKKLFGVSHRVGSS